MKILVTGGAGFIGSNFVRRTLQDAYPGLEGAEAQARELARSRVPIVVAVSCNAATFARDVKILIDGGYRLHEVTPVDQFRYSAHVEIVARLTR